MNANKLKRLAVAICAAVALLPSQKAHAASSPSRCTAMASMRDDIPKTAT